MCQFNLIDESGFRAPGGQAVVLSGAEAVMTEKAAACAMFMGIMYPPDTKELIGKSKDGDSIYRYTWKDKAGPFEVPRQVFENE